MQGVGQGIFCKTAAAHALVGSDRCQCHCQTLGKRVQERVQVCLQEPNDSCCWRRCTAQHGNALIIGAALCGGILVAVT